jgi:hypothetical protein
MDTPRINYIQKRLGNITGITGIICLLLAIWFSLASGISYPASLAQVTLFYQYTTIHLSTLISR